MPCDQSSTVSRSGHRVRANRSRRSVNAASGTSVGYRPISPMASLSMTGEATGHHNGRLGSAAAGGLAPAGSVGELARYDVELDDRIPAQDPQVQRATD